MDVRRQGPEAAPASTPAPRQLERRDNSMLSRLFSLALTLAALALVVYLGVRATHALTADTPIKSKEYQALFLTNGQVYFGKLSDVSSGYVKMSDIYYLQVQQTVQPTDAKATTDANNQQVSLAKLGSELHGPEDVMYVSRSQVLFWENLKNDGKVTKAIKDYQAQGK